MKTLFLSDTHFRDEEPFFVAGEAFVSDFQILLKGIVGEEDFTLIHGGDVFHRAKETGRVNGIAVAMFLAIESFPNCQGIYIIQGNHDVRSDTGSSLDVFSSLSTKIEVIKTPRAVPLFKDKYLYALPHMTPYSYPGYKTIASYSDPDFHAPLIEDMEDKIILTSGHFGDETSGEFFQKANISFLPGIHCNGDIHKEVSSHYPGAAMITRRDEAGRHPVVRVFDENGAWVDHPLPVYLDYVTLKFGETATSFFERVKPLPQTSCIVDITGHDDEEAASEWFEKEFLPSLEKDGLPQFFLGKVYPDEKDEPVYASEGEEEGEMQKIDIKGLFSQFCKEKGIASAIGKRVEALF
jgi:hypothetical protein